MAIEGFRFEGLDELKSDLQKIVSKYPDETEKEVFRLAGVWTKDVNSKLDSVVRNSGTGKRPLSKSWKRSREYGGSMGAEMVSVEITNTAPHWHLIEHGHNVLGDPKMAAAFLSGKLDPGKRKGKKSGKRHKGKNVQHLGFASGKHCAEATREEWNNGEFAEHVEKYLDRMLKEENL